jgi:hypothetical protein
MKKPRALLLICAFLLTVAATRPAKSDDCIIGYFCADDCIATPIPEKRLCREVICNGVAVSVSCDPCAVRCILPPG